MQIRKLDTTNARDVNQWIEFPFTLYRDHPLWVPNMRSDTRRILNKGTHPFYEHSIADFFVAESKGKTLGKVAALVNRNYNSFRNRQTGFFGYFDAVDDQEVAGALLAAVQEWCKAQGMTDILGPRGVIGVDGSVLVDGFEHPPALGIPWNYDYYGRLLEETGLEKDADWLSGYAQLPYTLPERIQRVTAKIKKRGKYEVKSFTSRRELRRWVPRILEVHRAAFAETRTFYPPTERETKMVVDTLLLIADHRLIRLIMKDEKIIGFLLAYRDISDALRKMKGRIFPLGWYHFLRGRRTSTWLNVNGLGMLPEYQGLGGNAVLYSEMVAAVNKSGCRHVDIVQVGAHNYKSRSDMESIGIDWYKTHRHYRKDI